MSGQGDTEATSPWNSLEFAKLVLSAMIPASVLLAGYFTSAALQQRQNELSWNSKLL